MTSTRLKGIASAGSHRLDNVGLYLPSSGGLSVNPLGLLASDVDVNNAGSATVDFTVPTGLLNGDVVLIHTFRSTATNPGYTGEGFNTSLGTSSGTSGAPDRGISTIYKVITDAAAEKAKTTWTFTSASSADSIAFMWVFGGIDQVAPIDVHAYGNTFNTLQPLPVLEVTTVADNCFVVSSAAGGKSSSTTHEVTGAPSGYEATGFKSAGSVVATSDVFGGSAYYVKTPAGLTQSDTFVHSNANTGYTTMRATTALKPA